MIGDRETRRAFRMAAARWRLTQAEVRMVLGLSIDHADRIQPDVGDRACVRRMRMFVRVEAGMAAVLGHEAALRWVRAPSAAYGGATPLQAMADSEVLRALVRVVAGVDAAGPAWRRS